METTKKNVSGQSSMELILVLGFIVVPALVIGLSWIKTEWSRSECALQTFKRARLELLQTQQKTTVENTCDSLQEKISLNPLEDLDRNKGALNPSDLIKEVSQLWELLSHS